MRLLDLDALAATPLVREPYDYLIVKRFVRLDAADAIGADYPELTKPGSFTLNDVTVKGAFEALIEELDGPEFRAAIETKFDLTLADRPTTFTVRGLCGPNDGQIHTDSKSKIITILIYLNPAWASDGGRLRVLRNGHDLDAVAAETPPDFGTLLAFRRSDHSWHGHKPYVGPRRVVQMNWVTSERAAGWQMFRHRVSAAVKRLTPGERPKTDAA